MFVDAEYGACFMPVAILGHRILMWLFVAVIYLENVRVSV